MTCIAVVGAGLMGRLIALSLHRERAKHGYQVTLFDKDDKSGHQSAAYAAAGLLTPLGESMHSEANIVEMGFESLKLWPAILASLDEYTFFQQEGAIMVSHEQDKGDYLRVKRYLEKHYPQYPVQQLNRQQLLQLEPEIGRSFNQALYLPEEGQIGNRKLLIALRHQLEKEQVNWLSQHHVLSINQQTKGCQLTYQFQDKSQQANFDLVIDCRGIGAKKSAINSANFSTNISGNSSVNDPSKLVDLRAVRGELMQLYAPDVHITRPIRLMHPRYQLYIAPKGKGFYVVGATEIESEDNSPMTVRSAMELLSAAYSVHPGFAEANIRQHVCQLRPAFNDNQPKVKVSNDLIQINGLYRHGFLIAPVMLEQVKQSVRQWVKGSIAAVC
ncbi:MAG: glycine oxidase ThiO [Colwellia sp.]|nr:glycine oxidase ThiO [Colwellia sp.]